MEQLSPTSATIPTLRDLVKSLGQRTTVIHDAQQLLLQRGHTFSKSAIYSTINRNGRNNAAIEAALLDAIEAERSRKDSSAARRQALAS